MCKSEVDGGSVERSALSSKPQARSFVLCVHLLGWPFSPTLVLCLLCQALPRCVIMVLNYAGTE